MSALKPEQVHAYLAGLTLAFELEIEELRKAPVELKLRQLWALMTSAHLLQKDTRRETRARNEVRRRWARLYRTHRGRNHPLDVLNRAG